MVIGVLLVRRFSLLVGLSQETRGVCIGSEEKAGSTWECLAWSAVRCNLVQTTIQSVYQHPLFRLAPPGCQPEPEVLVTRPTPRLVDE